MPPQPFRFHPDDDEVPITMAEKAKVELTHPGGKFTVTVNAERAETLKARGYTPTGVTSKPAPKTGAKRT